MREFFVGKKDLLETFGIVHLICILIVVIGIVFIVINRKKIYSLSDKTKRKITIFLIAIMFLNMSIYYLSEIIYGTYDYKTNLPFHFCFISGYLFMYAWFFKKKSLIKITYFLGYIGPLVAIIWPDVYPPNSFVFYQFFISHHLFLCGNLFLYYAYNYKIEKKDVIRTFVFINAVFIFMCGFNYIFKTNYIMSNSLPEFFLELYPIFRKIDYPAVLLEVAAILIMLIAYIPVYFNKNCLHKQKNLL
ncbi:MAG: TIGR02206 family membrane protein [Bacilli bacterium]